MSDHGIEATAAQVRRRELLDEADRLRAEAEQVQDTADAVQLTRDDLKGMPPDDIVAARRRGQLDDLLAGRTPT